MASTTATTTTGRPPAEIMLTVELIGILILAVVAGVNDDLGQLAVIFMVGIALGWTMINSQELGAIFSKAGFSGSSGSGSGTLFV